MKTGRSPDKNYSKKSFLITSFQPVAKKDDSIFVFTFQDIRIGEVKTSLVKLSWSFFPFNKRILLLQLLVSVDERLQSSRLNSYANV